MLNLHSDQVRFVIEIGISGFSLFVVMFIAAYILMMIISSFIDLIRGW